WAWFFPDGAKILILGREKGKKTQLFEQTLASGVPRPLPVEGAFIDLSYPFSPDGREVLVLGKEGWVIQPLEGGPARPIPNLDPGADVLRFAGDRRILFLRERGDAWPVRVVKLDVSSGRKQPWLELRPSDLAGALPPAAEEILLTSDGRCAVYKSRRSMATLFLVAGPRW